MTISPDWQPVIGGWPEVTGLYCATGFSGQGFQISPAVGKFLADLVAGDRVPRLLPFSPARLTAGQLLRTKQAAETYGLLG
jgi:sarcosine oxidase subunit beta